MRIDPVDPHGGVGTATPVSNPTQALGRSGLDLLDLFETTDVFMSRPATGPVAMEVGLEQARGALLRNLPGDALALLDGIWDRARQTEEGWYLRSGALTVLGLPGESERVVGDALAQRPASMALRFMQSIARVAIGDLAGARAVLQPALQRAPGDPLLVIQHALVQARQGDTTSAERMLARLESAAPDHPTLLWGRATLRTIVADATRQRSCPTPSDWPSSIDPTGASSKRGADTAIFGPAIAAPNDETSSASAVHERDKSSPDVAAAALERFGARIAMRPLAELAREARMLMRAFSAGGTLAAATSAEQAHASRIVLMTFLAVATDERAETPTPVRAMVEQIIPWLQQGRADDAERLVRRQNALAREPIGRLLMAVVRGALLAAGRDVMTEIDGRTNAYRSGAASGAASGAVFDRDPTRASGSGVVRSEPDRGPVIPIRLGLGLLEETPATRAALDPAHAAWTVTGTMRAIGDDIGMHGAESAGIGWGAAASASTANGQPPTDWSAGAGLRAIALVCVALALGALVLGHGGLALGLAAGATWLGLRGGGRADTHEPPSTR